MAYPYGCFSDSMAQKGVLYTLIKVKDTYIQLFNTHLQASYIGPNINEIQCSIKTRELQLHLLRDFINQKVLEHIKENQTEPGLVLLCGDLNVNSNKETNLLKQLQKQFEIQGRILTDEEDRIMERAMSEYETMINIMSNYQQD